MTQGKDLQLASQSPRRRALLEQIGVGFDVVSAVIDETPFVDERPDVYVRRLAEAKARAGYATAPGCPTLGGDTVVVCEGALLGKPRDKQDAKRMLSMLSGSRHEVLTSVAIFDGECLLSRLSRTCVEFKILTKAQIERYWQTGEPRDKAGAYGVQGLGAVFVKQLSGSYSGVVGLPLAETAELLNEVGVLYWQ